MSDDATAVIFREAVSRLHKVKDAAYRNAWKRRGETISIIANIARKVDRLEYAVDGAPSTQDESLLDTVVDLLVYAIKYQTFLADQDEAVASALFGGMEKLPPYSDGAEGFELLMAQADLTQLEEPQSESLAEATHDVLLAFTEIEAAVGEPLASAAGRLKLAQALVAATTCLLGVLRHDAPERYHSFLAQLLKQETSSARE
jgi:hypothetical protein